MHTLATLSLTRMQSTCRCADVPHVFRSIRDFYHLRVIIPGPDEPKSIDPYVDELFQDLKKYGPSGVPPWNIVFSIAQAELPFSAT